MNIYETYSAFSEGYDRSLKDFKYKQDRQTAALVKGNVSRIKDFSGCESLESIYDKLSEERASFDWGGKTRMKRGTPGSEVIDQLNPGLKIRIGILSNYWQNFKNSFMRSVTFGALGAKFNPKKMLGDKNISALNSAIDKIDAELKKHGWKVMTLSDCEKIGFSKGNDIDSFASALLTLLGYGAVARMVSNKNNFAQDFALMKKYFKGRVVEFFQPNLLDLRNAGVRYGGIMHMRGGVVIMSIKPDFDERYEVNFINIAKFTYFVQNLKSEV